MLTLIIENSEVFVRLLFSCLYRICIIIAAILAQAVSELRKGQGHVSFRQSRLTMLLRDALSGNSKTVLIVCALQEHDFLDETVIPLLTLEKLLH